MDLVPDTMPPNHVLTICIILLITPWKIFAQEANHPRFIAGVSKGPHERINRTVFSQDGSLLVLSEGRRGSTVRRGISLWEIPTLDPIWRLDAAPVGYPAISPDNSLIAFLGHIGGKFGLIVYEWKSEKLTTLKELPFSLKDYYTSYLWATPVNNRLIFSPDGTLLILSGVLTTNQRAIVAVWSTSTWDEISLLSVDLRTIAGSDADKILEISLSPNNKFIAITFLVESIGEDGGILILDATNGNKICENKGVGKIAARRAMFSPDGKKVAVVASDGNPFQHFFYIRILDVFTCESIQEI